MSKTLINVVMCLLLVAIVGTVAQADKFVARSSITSKQVVEDWGGFGNLEGRAVMPFYPATLDIAGGVAIQITTLPKAVPFIGYRKLFVDGLVSTQDDDRAFLGASMSLSPADDDNGFRLGVEVVGPNPWETWYLGKAFNFEW